MAGFGAGNLLCVHQSPSDFRGTLFFRFSALGRRFQRLASKLPTAALLDRLGTSQGDTSRRQIAYSGRFRCEFQLARYLPNRRGCPFNSQPNTKLCKPYHIASFGVSLVALRSSKSFSGRREHSLASSSRAGCCSQLRCC